MVQRRQSRLLEKLPEMDNEMLAEVVYEGNARKANGEEANHIKDGQKRLSNNHLQSVLNLFLTHHIPYIFCYHLA